MSSNITEVTQRVIINFLSKGRINPTKRFAWAGDLPEDEFLARLYDLNSMPSNDRRFSNAAQEIHCHQVTYSDWDADWVFSDSRFDLLHASEEQFLQFLCETVHPTARPNQEEAQALVDAYNQELSKDGLALVVVDHISDRPVYGAQTIGQRIQLFEEPTGWQKVDRQFQEVSSRLDNARTEEHYQSVGLLCREALITVAQEVYDPKEHPTPDGVEPSRTDAGRMLEAYFTNALAGKANEEARTHAKAALKLANALQHKRTADFRMAALCAEATVSVVNIVAILSGRRDRQL